MVESCKLSLLLEGSHCSSGHASKLARVFDAETALPVERLLKGKTSPAKSLLQKVPEVKVLLLVSTSQMVQEPGFQEAECTTRCVLCFCPKLHAT